MAPPEVRTFGLDLSRAQLARARRNAPRAGLVRADMEDDVFRAATFDVVTSFWAAYAYLDDEGRILDLVRRMTRWLRPAGVLYLEVLAPEDLPGFNDSVFAARTGFRVQARSPDWTRWAYLDSGGEHRMTSPPVAAFRAVLDPCFDAVEAEHDGTFMTHVVARGRRRG